MWLLHKSKACAKTTGFFVLHFFLQLARMELYFKGKICRQSQKSKIKTISVPTKSYPFGHWKFENFNPVQSRMMDFYDKETSGLIAATTSSGKTVVAEIFLAQEIHQRGGKGMYLVPMRALAQEKIDEWTDEKHHFGKLKISICTGDYRLTKERAKELEEADLIIMTSEMLNHRSRNFKAEQNNFLKNVGTIIVDESHLADCSRSWGSS
jgi:replicative superfamily II helicase